jgi:hypothetical protein
MSSPPRRHQFGASLVEAMIVLAISGLLLGSVLPGWGDARDRRSLEAASAQLATAAHDGGVRLWDLNHKSEFRTYPVCGIVRGTCCMLMGGLAPWLGRRAMRRPPRACASPWTMQPW